MVQLPFNFVKMIYTLKKILINNIPLTTFGPSFVYNGVSPGLLSILPLKSFKCSYNFGMASFGFYLNLLRYSNAS